MKKIQPANGVRRKLLRYYHFKSQTVNLSTKNDKFTVYLSQYKGISSYWSKNNTKKMYDISFQIDILVIFSITLMGHFKHNTPKQHSHTIKRYLFTIQNDMDHLSTSAGVWCAAPHLHVKIYNICLNFRISLETQYSKRNSFCIFCQNDENAIESGFFP